TVLEELKVIRLSLIDDQKAFHEKWIERKIIEGKLNEHNIDEFEDYKRINGGATSKVYRARFKSTKNTCALKYIESNNHTNKELVNELDHMLSIKSHKNIIKLHGVTYEVDRRDPNDPASLLAKIRDGLREKPIDDTPHEYVTIYTRCWKSMQDDRPSIEEVAMAFEDFVVQDIAKDDSFVIHDISEFEEFIKNSFENININIKLNAAVVGQDEMSLFFISQNDKTNEEVFQWLLANNNHLKNTCLLGLFYRWNIGTAENNIAVLVDAANKGDAIAQYFVGKCYETGWGIKKNTKKAIEWYAEAVKNNCAAAECVVGEYYYKQKKYNKAFYWLKRAAERKNYKALDTLGLCYKRGQGTDTNAVEGFKSFEKAALWGLPTSQYELGNCYEYGIGTKINLDQALYWYQKATEANPNYLTHLKRVNKKKKNSKITISAPESNIFDRIKYFVSVVTVDDKSKDCNGVNRSNETEGWINISESMSVHSTIFQKPSDTVYTEAEKLFSLLKKRKDSIDRILKSQLVYAIGPDFQNDYSKPYIACWAARPLDKTIMKKISSLFDDKFGVVYHLVNAEDISRVETDDKKEFQNFNITIGIWAKVGLDSYTSENTLEFKIYLKNCGVSRFLSEKCQFLENFICYYLDSFKVSVSPISKGRSNIMMMHEHRPQKKNNNEWNLDVDICEADGVLWSYQFISNDAQGRNRETIPMDKIYFGHWYIKNEGGFRITITQELGCKDKQNFFTKIFSSTPKLLQQYPNLVHKLEISFNKISNFNDDFIELTKSVHSAPNHTPEDKQPPKQKNNTEFKRQLSS
ncbi:25664_t:CDS:2, partial [Dentiscutata erythropus]